MAGALVRGPIYSSNPSTMNISNSDELKPRCKCCPYGYHIDLDFVQFCELFSQNNTLSASKQRRREKRLQRQSMEVLLGLTSPVVWNLEQHLPKIPQEDCVISSSNSSQTAKIVQDALHGAVQDFQDTLERAQCASFADKAIFLPTNEELEEKYIFSAGASPELEVCAAVGKHSGSVMSLSSIGTPSYSPAYANRDIPDGLMYSALQGMSPINDYDTSSITSAASGLSAGALQSIREQMALSLKRMKELEEQVKLIPVLQVQLSVLKEEKRKLLLQLRQEEVTKANNDKLLKLDTLPQASKQNFESLSFRNTLPRRSKGDENKLSSTYKEDENTGLSVCHYCSKLFSLRETHSQTNLKDNWLRHRYQDVGVTCSVVTRDVGVCHQQPRMYDAETYVNFGEKFVTLENNTKINLTSTSPSQPPVEKLLYIPNSLNGILSKRDIAVNTFWQRNRIGVQTEISQCHAATQKDFPLPKPEKVFVSFKIHKNKKMKKLKARLKRKFKNHNIVKRHSVGLMTEFEEMCKKPEKDERVQHQSSLKSKYQKNVSVGTCPFMPTSSNKSIDTSELYASIIKDAAVSTVKVQVADVAVGDRNINLFHRNISGHLPYESSQNKYRDIAVNTQKADVVDVGVGNKMYNLFQRSVSCQCNTMPVVCKGSYKDSATNTVKTKVIDIAVGNRYSNLIAKNVSCQCNIQNNDIKSNMRDGAKVKTVDAMVGCEDRFLLQRSVSCQCDSMTEETFVNSSKKSPSLSRIPRPIDRNVMTSQHAKEKINFQDFEKEYSYTKFPLDFDPEQKIVKTVPKESDMIEKGHIEEVSKKLAAVPTESTCLKLKVHEVEHHDEQPVIEEKRFRTSTASLGLHMLGTSRFENSIQKDLVTSSTDSNLERSFTFQPIQDVERKKSEPSKEIKAAIKVLNDCLMKSNFDVLPTHVKSAANIIQQEWFHVSSTSSAAPLEVEDYLDFFEETSSKLLEYVVNMTDISGNTAMHYAVSHGNFDVVSILLDSKVCNINQPNAAGYTCVMLVSLAEICSETHRQVVRRLFQLADVNVRAQQHGQTALMLAVSHGRLDTVKLLVEAGADMNIQDEDGSTALMCAAEHGHKDIVKQLLSNPDCDVGIADCDGTTALDIAMEAGNRDIGVLIYGRQAFSRSTSPHISRHRRSKSATPVVHTSSPMRIQSPQTTGVSKARHDKTL